MIEEMDLVDRTPGAIVTVECLLGLGGATYKTIFVDAMKGMATLTGSGSLRGRMTLSLAPAAETMTSSIGSEDQINSVTHLEAIGLMTSLTDRVSLRHKMTLADAMES